MSEADQNMSPHDPNDPEMQVEKASLLEMEHDDDDHPREDDDDSSKRKLRNPMSSYTGRRRLIAISLATVAASLLFVVLLGIGEFETQTVSFHGDGAAKAV